MATHDRAITVFSADGQLLQVQYAQEAVKNGSPVVGIRGRNTVVIACEKKNLTRLQEDRTDKRIVKLDDHLMLAFAGLKADARVIIARAQIECQAHRLTVEDAATSLYITKYISDLKQLYTQSNGRRPFGISCLIGGVNKQDGTLHLYQTNPSGYFYEWKATAIGRNEKKNQDFLEKNYSCHNPPSEDGCVKLALKTLLQTAQPEITDFEVAVLKSNNSAVLMPRKDVQGLVTKLRPSTTHT